MTITKGTAIDSEIPITITITDKATLGGAGAQSGTLTIPITSPVSTTLYITWSKVNTGASGAAAIFAIVESTSGRIVFTDTDNSNIILKASLYIGGTVQNSDITYFWTSIPSGITGTEPTLEVRHDQVPSARSFMCTITYKNKPYKDVIALSDKTDPIYCVIESSNGDKFTNGGIDTTLTCRIFSNKGEISTEKYTEYSYTWKKYDAEGTEDESWGTEKTQRSITITSNDVNAKATFSCIVSK